MLGKFSKDKSLFYCIYGQCAFEFFFNKFIACKALLFSLHRLAAERNIKSKGFAVRCAQLIVQHFSLMAIPQLGLVFRFAILSCLLAGSAVGGSVYWDVNGGDPGQGGLAYGI